MVLQTIQPLIDKNRDLIRPINDEKLSFHLIDIDENSDFYFKVYPQKEGKHLVERKPAHGNSVDAIGHTLAIDEIPKHFEAWISILAQYNEIITIFDDPILKAYEDEFYQEFKILEDDAEYMPFKYETQKLIQGYLEFAKKELNEKKNEENAERIEAIIVECKQLEAVITKVPKNKIVEKLAKIWAKARKEGLDIVSKLYTVWKDETVKKVGEFGTKLIEQVVDSFNNTPSV